jgi:tRNA (cmo5U34)-methyltransferase
VAQVNLFETLNFETHLLSGVQEYIVRARQSIPGRDTTFLITRCCLETRLSPSARILVVGAGGGQEIISLGQPNPGWAFVGVDLSEQMLELARERIAAAGLANDVVLCHGDVSAVRDEWFDAATSLLTAHFIADDGSKAAFFTAIRNRLKAGAPFVLVDLCGTRGEPAFEETVRDWRRHAEVNGMPAEHLDKLVVNAMALPFVSEARELELLAAAGFTATRRIYQGLCFIGWLTLAAQRG